MLYDMILRRSIVLHYVQLHCIMLYCIISEKYLDSVSDIIPLSLLLCLSLTLSLSLSVLFFVSIDYVITLLLPVLPRTYFREIGRASCRERV